MSAMNKQFIQFRVKLLPTDVVSVYQGEDIYIEAMSVFHSILNKNIVILNVLHVYIGF